MKDIPWRHIMIGLGAFVTAYGLTQIAEGYNTVAFHWSWQAVLQGIATTGVYAGGLAQMPPGVVK